MCHCSCIFNRIHCGLCYIGVPVNNGSPTHIIMYCPSYTVTFVRLRVESRSFPQPHWPYLLSSVYCTLYAYVNDPDPPPYSMNTGNSTLYGVCFRLSTLLAIRPYSVSVIRSKFKQAACGLVVCDHHQWKNYRTECQQHS